MARKHLFWQEVCWLTAALSIVACGGSSNPTPVPGDHPDLKGTASPTPTPTPTQVEGSTPYNLERFAKVTASSMAKDDYAPDNAVRGIRAPNANDTEGYVWLLKYPAINSGFIKLEWNSEVVINKVKLFDHPKKDQQITSGRIEYAPKDTGTSPIEVPFATVPDEGSVPLEVLGTTTPVQSMTIRILSGKGTEVGLDEIVVEGTRVNSEIPMSDVIPYAYFSPEKTAHSPTKDAIYPDSDTGNFRLNKMRDQDGNSEWVSAGAGANTYFEVNFDRAYEISEIVLSDRASILASRFSKGEIVFPELSQTISFAKEFSASDARATVTPAVKVKKILIKFPDAAGLRGTDIGLAGIRVNGQYVPAE